jgi:lysophospholipase L1-like esterase
MKRKEMMVILCLLAVFLFVSTVSITAVAKAQPVKGEEWDYVAIGDSVTWGFVDYYKDFLEEDLGVTVQVHNWTRGSDHSSRLLERLRTNEELRNSIRKAEVITFEIPWGVVSTPCQTYVGMLTGSCGGEDNQDCLREGFGIYKSDTEEILAEIVSLRSPSDALIRTMTTYQFQVARTKESGTFEVINKYWREANTHVLKVASAYEIPVAHVYDAFMGESGTEDPREKGLLYDPMHTTDKGAYIMAELFRDLGYENS